MNYRRRQFLQHGASLSVFTVFAATGLLQSNFAFGRWRKELFIAGDFKQTLNRLFQDREIIDTNRIIIKAPKTAENGATVPVTIKSDLDNINKVYLLVEKNPVPLVAEFTLTPTVAVYIKARIKMAESCDIVVIADSGEQLFRGSRAVNITVGGCGG